MFGLSLILEIWLIIDDPGQFIKSELYDAPSAREPT